MTDAVHTTSSEEDYESLSDLWVPDIEPGSEDQVKDLSQLLLAGQHVTAEQLNSAQTIIQQTPSKQLADVFYEMGIDEFLVQRAVAAVNRIGFEEIDPNRIDVQCVERLSPAFCGNYGVIPLRMLGNRLVLGVVQPANLPVIDEVRHKLGMAIKPVVVCRSGIATALESLTEEQDTSLAVEEIIAGIEEDDVEVVETKNEELDLEKMAGESPIIRFVNYLIFNGVKEGASDIHIEPQENKLNIRFRIDGVLFAMMTPPRHMHAAIVSRLKIMANLDISECRLPQDGRIRVIVHRRNLDLRLSTLPTAHGEKVVLRILDTRAIQVSLEELGIVEDQLVKWQHQLAEPHGIIMVTGPTGSGKTTTLYASLSQMDRAKLNISTVEDPIEYHLDGITQCQVHEKIDMTFAAALHALLRQDPDVVMVGEIRDPETARIAIQASLTGHLVLSTLHTNDAPSSIMRLINIGVEPYLIGAAVNACLAQRLIRRICPDCRTQVDPEPRTAKHLAMFGVNAEQVWAGKGCEKCRNTGYAGRRGLFELLLFDDQLRDKIASNPSVPEFRRMCIEGGMDTLQQDGFRKVADGITTVDEVLRVTESTI